MRVCAGGSLSVWKHDAVEMVKYLNHGSKSQVEFRTNSGHFVEKTLNPSDHSSNLVVSRMIRCEV